MKKTFAFAMAIGVALLETAAGVRGAAPTDWLQWGGTGRNFMPQATGLAASWPAGGPQRLWTRALGEGHSAILVEGQRIYTMYRPLGMMSLVRRSPQEIVTALDAPTGKTVWEFNYPAPVDGLDFSAGAGPHATPLPLSTSATARTSRRSTWGRKKNV